jgi:putative membrane protein
MMDYGMGWGFGWLGMVIFWIVPLILLLVGIKYLFSDGGFGTRNTPPESSANRALAILEERYAKGEINREEFVQKRDDLLAS